VRAATILAVALVLILAIGLLMPAVLKVREAANRINCENNLRLVALAIQNYHGTDGQFPPAAWPNARLPPERRLSWLVCLGPYYEATDLYVRLDNNKGWDEEENRYLALKPLRFLQCPSYPDQLPDSTFAPTHYVGVSGLGQEAATLPAEDPRAGFFGFDRRLPRADVAAQSSRLLIALETSRASGSWTAAGRSTVRGLDEEGPWLGASAPFGGNHPGGANALFADGSVRFIRESVDAQVLRAIATVQGSKGAEVVGDE